MNLINAEGKHVGTIDTRMALNQARNANLDLVELSFQNGMPLVKIMDYGKFKYESSKKQAENKKNQPKNVTKEIRLTPRIEKHDIEIKLKQIAKFIEEGARVIVSVQFRGRENTHKELGYQILESFKAVPGATTTPPRAEGNSISITLTKQASKEKKDV